MGRNVNQMITYNDAIYMRDNEGYTQKQAIPASTKIMTRSNIEVYLEVDTSGFSSYATNRTVPYQLIAPAVVAGDTTSPLFQNNGFNSGVYISDEGSSSVLCSWKVIDNVGVTSHRIYYKPTGGVYSFVTWNYTDPADTYDYVLTGLSPSTTYTIYVRSYDAAGNWTDSATDSTTTLAGADTSSPTFGSNALSTTGQTSSSISLSWTAATDNVGVTSYKVWKRLSTVGTFSLHATLSNSTTSYTVTGLAANTQYVFYVQATDAAGNTGALANTNTVSQFTLAAAATLTISPTTYSAGNFNESFPLTITTTAAWTLTDDSFWITPNATSGTGNAIVNISISGNLDIARSGIVTVSIAGSSKNCNIQQDAGSGPV